MYEIKVNVDVQVIGDIPIPAYFKISSIHQLLWSHWIIYITQTCKRSKFEKQNSLKTCFFFGGGGDFWKKLELF